MLPLRPDRHHCRRQGGRRRTKPQKTRRHHLVLGNIEIFFLGNFWGEENNDDGMRTRPQKDTDRSGQAMLCAKFSFTFFNGKYINIFRKF